VALRALRSSRVSAVLGLALLSACSYASHGDGTGGGGGDESNPGVDGGADTGTIITVGGTDASLSSGTVVSALGGVVVSSDGLAKLTIPPGALTQSTSFTIVPTSLAPPGALGAAYVLSPEGTKFAVPAELDITYAPSALGSTPASDVVMATAVNAAWEPQLGTLVDTQLHVVAALISHLSTWALTPNALTTGGCACTGPLVLAANTCCAQQEGAHAVVGTTCTCTGAADSSAFAACVTAMTGGDNAGVKNFSNACLSACCTKYADTPNSNGSGDCFGDNGSVHEVAACARDNCYGASHPPEWVVCAAGGVVDGGTVNVDSGGGIDSGFDGPTSINPSWCPSFAPDDGEPCSNLGACNYGDASGTTYAYCDGAEFEVALTAVGCPVDPVVTGQGCSGISGTCEYVDRAPDCFNFCTCTNGTWACGNDCDCVTATASFLSVEFGEGCDTGGTLGCFGNQPANAMGKEFSNLQCATSAEGTACASTATSDADCTPNATNTDTYTCTNRMWVLSYSNVCQ